MNAITAISNAFYMVEPIRPVSRKDGSQGIIADVKDENNSIFQKDKFTKSIESDFKTYDRNGRVLNKNLPDEKISNDQDSEKLSEDETLEETKKSSGNPASTELTPEEEKEVEKLKKIDREVRAHEQAHQAAGGGLIRGGPNYQYQKGPDNRNYAVAGEVQIDISPVPGDPQATIMKMQQVKRAAMAPADPSPQDRAASARASQIEAQARQELAKQNLENVSKSMDKMSAQETELSNEMEASNKASANIKQKIISKYTNENQNNKSLFDYHVGSAVLKN